MHEDGYIQAKVEDILELLDEKGTVSENLRERIEKEEDIELLKKWLKLAARVSLVEEFEKLVLAE